MSAAVQLSFLPPPQDELQNALRIFQQSGVRHASYTRFVRSLAVSFKSIGRSATIVAGCPSSPTLDEVIIGFRKEIKNFEVRNQQPPSSFEPLEIFAPSSLSRRQMEVELLDRYSHAVNSVRIGHRAQPQFLDDGFGAAYRARTAIGRLVALLKLKSPPLIIVRDAQNLKCPNASSEDNRAAWKLIIDIAKQSGVPHLIFAPVSTVKEVFSDPEMLGSVHLEVMCPYDLSVAGDQASFKGVLNDYNAVMPWGEKESILLRYAEIDEAVAGDVDRLRRWLVRAINHALVDQEATRVRWHDLEQTKPLFAQRLFAHEERRNAISLVDPEREKKPDPPPAAEKKPQPKGRKPGNRKAHRDVICKPAVA